MPKRISKLSQLRADYAAAKVSITARENDIALLQKQLDAKSGFPITAEAAYQMGAKGAAPTEAQRLLFEEYMRGHCWAVSGIWDGTTYVDPNESIHWIDPHARSTRMLWAIWRDCAALAAAARPAPLEITDKQIDAVFDLLPDGAQGFLKKWGYLQFARTLLERVSIEAAADANRFAAFAQAMATQDPHFEAAINKHASDDPCTEVGIDDVRRIFDAVITDVAAKSTEGA